MKKPTIVVYDGKRLAVDPKDIERLKSGKDIVGKSTKFAGQEEWISAKGKWEVVDEATVNEETVNEWGTSDSYAMSEVIHYMIRKPKNMPSPFDKKLRDAAKLAVDRYWEEWPEYKTNYDGLVDDAVRNYLRHFQYHHFQY